MQGCCAYAMKIIENDRRPAPRPPERPKATQRESDIVVAVNLVRTYRLQYEEYPHQTLAALSGLKKYYKLYGDGFGKDIEMEHTEFEEIMSKEQKPSTEVEDVGEKRD